MSLKRFLILILISVLVSGAYAQSGMSDSQVIDFVIKEQKAGSSQSQIVTKLMQRGVNIQQIQRIRKQYGDKINSKGMGLVADEAVKDASDRMRTNNGDKKSTKNGKSGKSVGTGKDDKDIKSKSSTSLMIANEPTYENTYDEDDDDFMKMRMQMRDMLGEDENADEDDDFESYYYNMKFQARQKPVKVFGRDIFNKKDLTFEPNMNIATPQNYVLGPGDKIYVDVYGATQKTIEATVSPDGEVVIDDFGPIKVNGLTVDQANARLRSTLGTRYASSNIKLSVGQTRTIMVNVWGEVKNPGTYTLSAFATVFHALYMANGISDIGTLRNIKIYRQGKLVSQADVYDYILNGKLTGNVRLADNDVIMVEPYDCLVHVTGKVKRPMKYEMKKSESLQTLLKYAGGFANDAYKQSVRVIRKNGRQYSVFNVTEFNMNSFKMTDGDSIDVDSILPRYENMVEIKGAVFRPGMYQIGNDINSVASLLKAAEGVTEEAFTSRAIMHRMKEDRTLEVLSIDLQGLLNGSIADIPLRNEDVLFVPTRQNAMVEQTITIHGEVHFPGTYKYADNETLEDFVLQAGGLNESASTMKVDVARRRFDPKATSTNSIIAETFSFQLQDGFVVTGEQAFKLEPFDEVYVRKNPTYVAQKNFSIEGEVNFAGTYTMANRTTRLSDAISQAGGISKEGYMNGARLTRRMTTDERKRMQDMLRMARANASGKDSIDVSKLEISETYSVGIELEKALDQPGSQYDIELREGDILTIPTYNGTVKINGAVMYPNTIAYTQGKKAKWYINHSGGYANNAKKRNAYIIRQSGIVEKIKNKTKVSPGSEIIVPEKAEATKISTAEYVAMGTGFASLSTMVATIASLFRK